MSLPPYLCLMLAKFLRWINLSICPVPRRILLIAAHAEYQAKLILFPWFRKQHRARWGIVKLVKAGLDWLTDQVMPLIPGDSPALALNDGKLTEKLKARIEAAVKGQIEA